MKDSSKIFFVMFFLSGWGVASAIELQSPHARHLSLGLGRSVAVEDTGLIVKFKAVLEDSRCPINALCTWTGNGKVEIEIIDTQGHCETAVLNTDEEPKATKIDKFKLILISLAPPRVDGHTISSDEYSVLLRVER